MVVVEFKMRAIRNETLKSITEQGYKLKFSSNFKTENKLQNGIVLTALNVIIVAAGSKVLVDFQHFFREMCSQIKHL